MKKMSSVFTAATVVALLAWTEWPSASAAPLAMTVSPAMSLAPATVDIGLHLIANRENHLLVVEADSGDFFRSSEIPVDGDHAPTMMNVRFRDLPEGEYQVVASLFGNDGRPLANVRGTIHVM
jgi:hypothetical protein